MSKTALYRVHAGDHLAYVGISDNVLRRIHQHATTKRWWIEATRVDIEWFDTREEAALAEARAIIAEKPQWNVVHTDRLRDDYFLLPQRDAIDRLFHEVAAVHP